MEFLYLNLWIVWIAVIVIFLVLEGVTTGLTSIWFALGGLAALIVSLFDAALWVQVVVFLAVSIIALVATKPMAKEFNEKRQTTNADMSLGKDGIVEEKIDNLAGTGTVRMGGKLWTARSANDEMSIDTGVKVVVSRIEGVKLIVDKAE